MFRIPVPALLLGLAGLLPFLWGAITHVAPAVAPRLSPVLPTALEGQSLLLVYGLVILCFMSGTIWAFATRATGRRATLLYIASVLPLLWGFYRASGDPQQALPSVLAGFLALLALDWTVWKQGLAPEWWLRLRLILTAVVAACLLVGILA